MPEILVGQLRGRMAFDGEDQFVPRHAAAVVGDRDQLPAAVDHHPVDAPRAGVDGVLDQFLDGGGRALDHLPRRNAVDEIGRKKTDGHGRCNAGTEPLWNIGL